MTPCPATSPDTGASGGLDATDPVGDAMSYVSDLALRDGAQRRVGLELEMHLVDLASPSRRPSWTEVETLTAELPAMPGGSTVTLEPGGQVELSTPPLPDVVTAVAALRRDQAVLTETLAQQGYGAAALGTDPARPVRRINPRPRYAAMEDHFDAVGCGPAGRAMMSGTAALQVNLDAGPRAGWENRLHLLRAVTPVLIALSACSSHLAGTTSGWHSMRQQIWHDLDPGRCGPVPGGHPGDAWAAYALAAPVMLVRDGDLARPVRTRVAFTEWLAEPDRLGRLATRDDLDHHLSTLFPPLRPRGYLEIRCLDAMPEPWWPALAALTTTLLDDPVAADAAAEACTPLSGDLAAAARDGLTDPLLRSAAEACVDATVRRVPECLRPEIEALAILVEQGRTPGDLLRSRIEREGPLTVLEEEARA